MDVMTSITASYAHGFLCGHLVTAQTPESLLATDAGWVSKAVDDSAYRNSCRFYYESFVDSILPRKQLPASKGQQIAHLVSEVGKKCSVTLASGDFSFDFERIHLYFLPLGIVLFALEIDASGADLNGWTEAFGRLREVNGYDRLQAPEYLATLQPLLALCTTPEHKGNYTDLTDTGNKLKLFQLFEVKDSSDSLLYELGALAPIGCVDNSEDRNSPDPAYLQSLLTEHKIAVFRNWRALALFDTMTMLSTKLTAVDSWTWRESYFRMIYIHVLYQKTLLFYFNRRFRSEGVNIEELMYDIRELEHYYNFSNISYNFLPQTLYEAIDRGMGMERERKALHQHIEQVEQMRNQVSERKLNRVIVLLTFLTLASTLYDGTSLLTEAGGIETGSCWYRAIAVGLALIAFSLILYIMYHNRHRKV